MGIALNRARNFSSIIMGFACRERRMPQWRNCGGFGALRSEASKSRKGQIMAAQASHPHRSIGFWWTMLVAMVLVLFGLPIAAGGLYLITLGGSWYYLPAGIGLLLTAWLLFRREMAAVWTYLVVWVATLIWALWEAGLEPWPQ